MPRFGAEMWHVDRRCRIIAMNAQRVAHGKPCQPLAQLEHGQGAQKADGVDIIHGPRVSRAAEAVHKLVTRCPRDAVRAIG